MENLLPKNWVETRGNTIFEITDYVANGSFKSLSENVNTFDEMEFAILLRLKDFNNNFSKDLKYVDRKSYDFLSKSTILPGDLFISNVGNPGICHFVPDLGMPITLGPNGIRLRIKNNGNIKFVKYFIESPQGKLKLNDIITGTAQLKFNKTDFRNLVFPLPPLAEQERIVAKLDALFAAHEKMKQALDKIPQLLKDFRQQVLAQAVTGKLTEQWREGKKLEDIMSKINYVHNSKLNPIKLRGKNKPLENLFNLPRSWNWVSLYKLVSDGNNAICAGPFGTIFKAKDFRDNGIPIIFLRHVKKEGFNQNKPVFMDKEVWNSFHQEYSIYGGELLVTKLGDPPGEAAIFPINSGIAMVTPDVMKASLDESLISTKLVSYFFNSPKTSEILSEISFGMTRLRIDLGMFKSMPIPVPSLLEQQEIVFRVESLFAKADAIQARYQTLKTKIESLPQAILHKAFKGELVPQLPTDGDAKELLADIIKLKEEAKPKRGKRNQ